jgi:hypothetical protein
MVPIGVAGVIAGDDIVAAAVPCADVETVPIDGVDMGVGAMVGDGRAGTAGDDGGKIEFDTDMNDVAGCAENARYSSG